MKPRLRLFLISSVLFVSETALADPAQNSALTKLLAAPSLKTATIGFAAFPIKEASPSGEDEEPTSATTPTEILYNPDAALTPASVQKVITTATALETLGPDYRFQTKLYQKGDDIIIRGGGDPLLASSSLNVEFSAWEQALRQQGLTEITGTLIADPSRFESKVTPNQWLWGDIGNYYGAGISGLNFHNNSYRITFSPGRIGAPASLYATYPKPPGVTFENLMRTGSSGSGDQGYAYCGPRRKLVTLRGTIPAGGRFTIKGALPDPPLMCLHAFQDYLTEKEFKVAKLAVESPDLNELEPFHITESPTLEKIIASTNLRSINLQAECLFKALTPEGTTTDAQKIIQQHWSAKGINLAGQKLHDGSGLSPQNLVTARQLALLLKEMSSSPNAKIFRDSLPVAGRNGTLRSFGRGTRAQDRVRAKSGSMEGVRAYAGYYKDRKENEWAFCLLLNHYNGSDGSARAAAASFLANLCSS